jgi:peptide/nickel transport system ATP-binding protein
VTGEVLLDGEDILQMKPGRLRAVRWTEMSIVFQGALHALNPVQRVGDQIIEAIEIQNRPDAGACRAPRDRRHPRATAGDTRTSSGQRQRTLIARAACNPRILTPRADDGTFDVMVQARSRAV